MQFQWGVHSGLSIHRKKPCGKTALAVTKEMLKEQALSQSSSCGQGHKCAKFKKKNKKRLKQLGCNTTTRQTVQFILNFNTEPGKSLWPIKSFYESI